MIIEVDTALLDAAENLNSNQLIFLSMVLDKNHKNNQDVRRLVSLMQDDEISYLLEQGLVDSIERAGGIQYKPSEKLLDFVKPEVDYFTQFYNEYPIYVDRPDGTKSYLRTNVNKCRNMFNQITNERKIMVDHLIKCLKFEIDKKMRTGKIGYMKTMWRWLVDRTWEESAQEMEDTTNKQKAYGQDII